MANYPHGRFHIARHRRSSDLTSRLVRLHRWSLVSRPSNSIRNSSQIPISFGLLAQFAASIEGKVASVNINPYIVLGSAVVGFLVGLTGAGGGALMTPMLILLFGVKPSTAISSDLVAAVFMRPFGAAVHMSKKTVNFRLVGWMVAGSVPMAFLGAYLLHLLGHAKTSQTNIEKALGAALLIGAAAMIIRFFLDRRAGHERKLVVHNLVVRPVPTVLIGMVGGLIVGMTSVGSGSLMIVMLLFLYPMLGANQLVGTDLTRRSRSPSLPRSALSPSGTSSFR